MSPPASRERDLGSSLHRTIGHRIRRGNGAAPQRHGAGLDPRADIPGEVGCGGIRSVFNIKCDTCYRVTLAGLQCRVRAGVLSQRFADQVHAMLKRRRAAKKDPTPDITTIRRAMRAKTFRRGLQITMEICRHNTLRAVAGQETKARY